MWFKKPCSRFPESCQTSTIAAAAGRFVPGCDTNRGVAASFGAESIGLAMEPEGKLPGDANIPVGSSVIGHRDYGHYYYAQAMYILGDDGYQKLFPQSKPEDRLTWSKYREGIFDDLVSRQSTDGKWADNAIGPIYGTACALTVLQLDNGVVPIYQRTPANN